MPDIYFPELVAVVFAVAYLLLAARENIWCWYCAFVSSAIYSVIFWDVNLLMESMLNIFYVVMAVIGWLKWRANDAQEVTGIAVKSLPMWQHLVIVIVMLVLALVNGWAMQRYTDAAWPFLDSFTTWAAVITTFMVAYKVLENWLYWIVIDSISLYLYLDRGLNLTVLLFTAYLFIAPVGYYYWRKQYVKQEN